MYDLELARPIRTNDLIRLGRKRDGGYVINERVLKATNRLLSFGISTDWSFERDFYKREKNNRFSIEAYDYSIDLTKFMKDSLERIVNIVKRKGPFIKNIMYFFHFNRVAIRFILFFNKRNIRFYKKGIGQDDSGVFFKTETIFNRIKDKIEDNSVFIKMDIEGDEYDVLEPMLEYADYINGFVIEFHDLQERGERFEMLLNLFKEKGYSITHIHANNAGGLIRSTNLPNLVEMTFVKSILFTNEELWRGNNSHYPLPGLDFPCVKGIPEISIRFKKT